MWSYREELLQSGRTDALSKDEKTCPSIRELSLLGEKPEPRIAQMLTQRERHEYACMARL